MQKKKSSGKKGKLLIAVLVVIAAIAVIYAVNWYWENWQFHGKVVDTGTGEPIEGVVVVATWRKGQVVGGSEWVWDVKEALTNKNGEWDIQGPKSESPIKAFIPATSFIKAPTFIVYKPGYCPWPDGYRVDACKGMYVNEKRYGNVGKGETLGLPKLTKREDRRRALPGPVDTTNDSRFKTIRKKQKNFIRLINEERRYLGFEEYNTDFLREDKDGGQ